MHRQRSGPARSAPFLGPGGRNGIAADRGRNDLTTLEDATVTPVVLGGVRGGPSVPTPRRDRWWVQPVATVTVLTAFVAYATWAAFVNKNYYVGAAAPPRPDLALLLAVPDRELRARQPPWDGHHLVDDLAGAADPDLPARLPPDLLLLPQGLLPVVLVGAAGVRGLRRPRLLHRRVAVPAAPAERPPLLLLLRAGLQRHPDHRRRRGLPPARHRHRLQRRYRGAPHQRRPAVAVLPQLPRVPPPVRRRREAVLRSHRSATGSGRPSPRSTPSTCTSPG